MPCAPTDVLQRSQRLGRWSAAEAEDFYSQAIDLERKSACPFRTKRIARATSPLPGKHGTFCIFPICVSPVTSATGSACANACCPTWVKPSRWPHNTAITSTRVGYAEGPQVPDPSAPEYAPHLAAHEAWWEQIWQSQKQRGFTHSTLTPEFGPPPYLQTLPHTNVPVADLTVVCDWMAQRQRERFTRLQ